MSILFYVTLFLCLIATAIFVAGYIKGVTGAVADHRATAETAIPEEQDSNYGLAILAAVLAASGIIAMVGFVPEMIYAGPFLAIVTATMNGVAFFVDAEG
ncbi:MULTISPECIES: hypothetical protein [unclassified Oceanobacter]|jgi:hypothetical protein|uniref:hypothetical protein n=1 Tax=unclassified Oceanobacter TaxID=2620260 RepID=UPI0026E1F8D9|nr:MULTISPECIES: hypothetical protein [unclassified Oceanobacter]MDO6682067.1 hypothetical protein [Oceanobacter sp. 5_MG-2023]MDP2505538.1 hypothetical protein [Oceanobacter sp. 3_MG-2023]MDP2547113.1 hypothetical protein [Oceanobacter sp. 4_MG-2023]MDP2609738.1 hypothetical protein [Oceanobacter sp. 1_MG-2023]MDP2613069.1 hypothetical protein [Oceanobacter sp. 2_MG-2023]